MAEFVAGVELGRALCREVVAPRLAGVRHSAARLGPGSDVLGYDTARSTDPDWGARLAVLVDEPAPPAAGGRPGRVPRLAGRGGGGRRRPLPDRAARVRPAGRQLGQGLAGDAAADPGLGDRGAVYHDGLGELEPVREVLAWYPRDLWLWQLAGQWRRIAQEEPFCGRADEAGDDLGRRVLVARLARDVIRLCFLLERRYAPYSTWARDGLRAAGERRHHRAAAGPCVLGRHPGPGHQPRAHKGDPAA